MREEASMSKIRILLIEHNRLLRERVVAMINDQADMKVVGDSGGHEGTLHKARTASAQVILVDVIGFRRVASLTKHDPGFRVIGTGLVPEQPDIVSFVRSGASGFILKHATSGEFLSTIRSVAHGAIVLPASLAGSLFSHVPGPAHWRGEGEPPDTIRVTKREREISELIAEGLSNKEIARQINVATYTVKSHVHNILEKRGLHNRVEIAKCVYEGPRLKRVNEGYLHSMAPSSDQTGTFPSTRSMEFHPMRTS
jgi:two-component system nitrate/nitrite response regulator NarL